jgi:integrase
VKQPKKRKYLYYKPDRENPKYIYFRNPRTGRLSDPLPLDETSREFADQYDALYAGLNVRPKAAAVLPRDPNVRVARDLDDGKIIYRPGTLGWFSEKYLASEKFDPQSRKAFAAGTRYNYDKTLRLLMKRLGGGMLHDVDQRTVETHSGQIAQEHGDSAGDDQIAMMSNLWKFAIKGGFTEFKRKPHQLNPTLGVERHYEHDGEGHLVWPEEIIEKFDADCPADLQFVRMGLHYTGQRGSDVAKMKWSDFDGKRIFVVQEKTGKKLWLNCPKPLLAALRRELRKTNREFIFVSAHGERFANAQTLSHAIRNRLDTLGIRFCKAENKNFTMHGLRKNAGIELALAGCTVSEIMAVLGHKTPTMAMFYVAQVDQGPMNENAVGKWDASIEKNAAKKLAKRRGTIAIVA